MYNIYKNSELVTQTEDTTYTFDGLEADTEYTLGVSKVVDGRESVIVEVVGRTKAKPVTPPENVEVTDSTEDSLTLSWS